MNIVDFLIHWIPVITLVASVIVKATPTPVDDTIMDKVMKVLRLVAVNARTRESPKT